MTLRIHFSQDDFALTSLAHAPDLTWESLLSMHMLQTTVGPVIFGQWRASVRRQLNAAAGQLLRLAPPVGYSPDFLTPTAGEDNPELALTSLKSTSKARLRHDMLELAHSGRRLPPWAPLLASSDRETLSYVADCAFVLLLAGSDSTQGPGLPGVLVYPMSHDADTEAPLGWDTRGGARHGRSLEALLGSTRAGILTCISDGQTTTEVSRKVGVSLATVSHHTSVLRGAGLVFTLRMGGAVLHRLTPLGSALLHAPG